MEGNQEKQCGRRFTTMKRFNVKSLDNEVVMLGTASLVK